VRENTRVGRELLARGKRFKVVANDEGDDVSVRGGSYQGQQVDTVRESTRIGGELYAIGKIFEVSSLPTTTEGPGVGGGSYQGQQGDTVRESTRISGGVE